MRSESVSNNFSEKKIFTQESPTVFSINDSLQQDWVEIARFRFRGSLFLAFIYLFFFCAIFQLLVLAIFGAGAIFQLLVLATFGDFLEDSFLALFSASGLSDFWRGRHFLASGLSDFWRFL